MPYEYKEWRSTQEIHPSEFAVDFCQELGIPLHRLHEHLGVPREEIEEFVNTRSPVSRELAPKLGDLLGFEGGFWLRLQRSYEKTIERNRDREAAGINTTVYKMLDEDGLLCSVVVDAMHLHLCSHGILSNTTIHSRIWHIARVPVALIIHVSCYYD